MYVLQIWFHFGNRIRTTRHRQSHRSMSSHISMNRRCFVWFAVAAITNGIICVSFSMPISASFTALECFHYVPSIKSPRHGTANCLSHHMRNDWHHRSPIRRYFKDFCRHGQSFVGSIHHKHDMRHAIIRKSDSNTQLHMITPGMEHTLSHFMMSVFGFVNHIPLPFAELGRELSESLDIGSNLSREIEQVPTTTTSIVLSSLGYDLLVFLAASVFVTPFCKVIGITPILGYLVIGAIMGPHGFDVFSNSHADVELGDIGILFLLFSEGLEVSNTRLKKLTNFLPLGFAQISLITGVITAAFLLRVPQFLDQFLPLDSSLIDIHDPVEAVVLAFAGSLSTSAFIFPVLKERGWEEEESGEAATSILLLQDLLVAPLLVLLPFLVGESKTDYTAIGFLTAKAVFGFGAIMYAASFALSKIFNFVARTRSTETFVALCLLVAAGMGALAKQFGLTDTAGAFAAGMLLANTNYRAQIQADILPFKGILLGIFFMDAGSTFDSELVLREFPTILVGALGLMVVKFATLGAATRVPRSFEPNRLSVVDAIRVTMLLSGGGEFAFVVLALSEKLKLISHDLSSILTAIVLLTMGVTPILGQAAEMLSEKFAEYDEANRVANGSSINGSNEEHLYKDSIVVCGYGEIGRSLIRTLDSELDTFKKLRSNLNLEGLNIVAFDTYDSLPESDRRPTEHSLVLYGNGASSEVIRSSGITQPAAIFVAYEDHSRVLAATSRLRAAFRDVPIYARAAIRAEVKALQKAGATEVVVESDEMPRAAPSLLRGVWSGNLNGEYPTDAEQLRVAAAAAAGVSLTQADELLELFASMDQSNRGLVTVSDMEAVLERSTNWIASDDQITELNNWFESTLRDSDPIDEIGFCTLYGRSPDCVKLAFGVKYQENPKTRSI